MKSFFGFLINDWRRKLVAIAIALALWSWIEGRIANDNDVTLTIAFTTEDIGTPEDFQLLVQAPPGWVLTSPSIGDTVKIVIHGSKSQVQSFKSQQCAANFVASFIADEDSNLETVKVLPEQLNWMRPNDAKLLLDNISEGKKELRQLVFERVKTATVTLTPKEISVTGTPSEAHEVRTEELVFSPNSVTISGAQTAVDELLAEIDSAHSADGSLQSSNLLSNLQIADGTRNDTTQMAQLNGRWSPKGIEMFPNEVLVEAKVRLKQPLSMTFNPSFESIQVIPPSNPDAVGKWELSSWEPQPWLVTSPHFKDGDAINTAWISEHVRLFVLLPNLIPDENVTTLKVRLEAHIVGIEDPAEQSFYEQHIVVAPTTGSDNDMITVKRKQ